MIYAIGDDLEVHGGRKLNPSPPND